MPTCRSRTPIRAIRSISTSTATTTSWWPASPAISRTTRSSFSCATSTTSASRRGPASGWRRDLHERSREAIHVVPVRVLVIARRVGLEALRFRNAPHDEADQPVVFREADRAGDELALVRRPARLVLKIDDVILGLVPSRRRRRGAADGNERRPFAAQEREVLADEADHAGRILPEM